MGDVATFWIVPDMNPDGAAANAPLAAHPEDLPTHVVHAVREAPGDDVEFNWPRCPCDAGSRPENLAAAAFLASAGGPFDLHCSLHGMAFAEGAWFLTRPDWVQRALGAGFIDRLSDEAVAAGLGLHDQDRRGEKGFTRIAPGHCTTPSSQGMRDFFVRQHQPEVAALFRPSSMEWIASLGGDPLCLVSEIPLFELAGARSCRAPLDERPLARLRGELPAARTAAAIGDLAPLEALAARYRIRPVPWRTHSDLQLAMIREGIRLVSRK